VSSVDVVGTIVYNVLALLVHPYALAAMHSITDRRTDKQTDVNVTIADDTTL